MPLLNPDGSIAPDYGNETLNSPAPSGAQSLFGNVVSGGLNYLAGQDATGNIAQAGQTALDMSAGLGERAITDSAFKPFTVTSNIANTTTTPTGGVNIGLGDQANQLQQSLLGSAGQQAGQLGYTGQQQGQFQNIGQTALGGAQNFLGQSQQYDPSIAGQREAVGGLFGQQLQQGIGAPSNIGDLQQQYAGLAGQAGQGLFQDQGAREQDIYNRIRATQQPEEERNALALRDSLFAQGRGGVQTSQFGGTPEQLAMAKAQAEAQNSASLSSIQQAQSEQQQQFGQFQGLGAQAGALAQTGSGLEAQNLQQLLALQGSDQGAAQAQQSLQAGNQQLGAGLMGIGQQSLGANAQLQGADLANLQSMLQAGYSPNNQALAELGASTNIANIAGTGQRAGAEFAAQSGSQGLQAYMQSLQLGNDARAIQNQEYLQLLSGGEQGGLLGSLGLGADNATPDWIKAIGDSLGFGGNNSGYGDIGDPFADNFGGNS